MNEQELMNEFYDIQNGVYKICIYEELIDEIKKMSGSSTKDIVTKLRLILLNKRIADEGRKELEDFISNIERLSPQEIDLSTIVFDMMISNMKSDLERKFADFVPRINDERYTSFHPLIDLLIYALELDTPIFDFIKGINDYSNFMSELEERGAVIKIDTDAMYKALKSSKENKDDFPRN